MAEGQEAVGETASGAGDAKEGFHPTSAAGRQSFGREKETSSQGDP